MQLTDRERRLRDGAMGEPLRRAIDQQVAVGEFFGAERLVPVTNVHMMGDMEVMGDAGFEFVQALVSAGARFAVPVTTNARCVDFDHAEAVRQDPALVTRERALVQHLRALGAMQVDTCAGRRVAPAAVLFGRTNPVMIQGLVLAGIPTMHQLVPDPFTVLKTGDRVRVSPERGTVERLP